MKENMDVNEKVVYISDLSVESLIKHLGISNKQAEELLSKMTEDQDSELISKLTTKGQALLNKLPNSPSGEKRDYIN